MRTLSYSNVRYTHRVPLILLTVNKIECENFNFVLLLCCSSSFFFFLIHNSKLYGIYEQSAHQMTTLLSEIFFFWVRAACKLRLASYSSNTHHCLVLIRHFVDTYTHNLKTTDHLWTFSLSNNCSTIRDVYFLG